MPLSVAAFYTEEPKYIERVALLFRTFFTDPETAMSPTMEFDDYEPGRKGPPGYNVGGTIDIARFHATLDCLALLEWLDDEQHFWTATDRARMSEWVQAFFTWWVASPQGISASRLASNFAISWDTNAMAMAHYLVHATASPYPYKPFAVSAANGTKRYVDTSIANDGHLPTEDANPDSFGYSTSVLIELLQAAKLVATVSAAEDLYTYTNALGGSILKALEYHAPYCASNGSGWPWPVSPVLPINTSYPSRCKLIFQQAGQHYHRPEWLVLAKRMPGYKDVDDFWTYMMSMNEYVALCYP